MWESAAAAVNSVVIFHDILDESFVSQLLRAEGGLGPAENSVMAGGRLGYMISARQVVADCEA